MSLRHLNALFRPRSVAVVGASNRPKSIGSVVMRNLLNKEFSGPILPVNPRYKAVGGILAYSGVADLPLSPDLAIICTPPKTVPGFMEELGKKGAMNVLIMSTDLEKHRTEEGQTLRQATLELARRYSMRILGPNCLGLIVPRSGLNASFGHTDILKGQIAFISQSDSLGIAVLDWAHAKGIGFSCFISLGDCADIDFADVIDYLGSDPHTTSILLYIEQVNNPRKFISAARSASRNKPLMAIKGGSMSEHSECNILPCGTEVYEDDIYDAIIRRAGMLRVSNVAELFDAVETMARSKRLRGDRLAILSNGGGPAVMTRDILISQGGRMATLSQETLQEFSGSLEEGAHGKNPVRVMDHASSDTYSHCLETLLKDEEVDAVMVIHVPTAFASSQDIAGAVVNSIGRSRKNVFTVWLGEEDTVQARRIFALAGIPTYETPDQAAQLFMDMVRYRRNQEALMEAPDSVPQEFTPDSRAARAIVYNALEEGRYQLGQSETKEILSSYAIPVLDTRIAENLEDAELMAQELGYPVALKLLSPDVVNKQQMGGVALDLENGEDLRKRGQGMLNRLRELRPHAEIQGFILQKMARRPEARELMAGVATDPLFGPVVVFGQGGAASKVWRDIAVGLPPLNMSLAKELIQRTRIHKLLQDYGGQSGVNQDPLRLVLVQLSQLIIDVPEVHKININPLLADPDGVLAVDSQIEIQPTELSGPSRLAIRPYPKYLEEWATLPSGLQILLRPIRPEDEPIHMDFINKLSEEDLRMRFFGLVHEFTHSQLAQLTQIDYDREMAFVATRFRNDGDQETIGVVRSFFDPDNVSAEFAIVVRTDIKEKGLGKALMEKMIRFCRERGTREMVAYTLRENRAMQALAQKFDFQVRTIPDDPETIELHLDLAGEKG
ncbi:MAG: bifunctional acetate--CoA ligase family protein/GNAT family N-acetyltransferase [Desulfohalobiaceae bacterium]|nr:bifunctional acetate--CoA ligase family protein/GNAT family N-acetyltransferase [Desulfohalobiaceae bacterium]